MKSKIVVNLSKYGKNLSRIRSTISPTVKMMAVLKANAYGHGILEIGRAAVKGGADRLGVARVEEGVLLREAGLTKTPIHVFGSLSPEEMDIAVENNLIPAIMSLESLNCLDAVAKTKSKTVLFHLKVDTGMHRMGIPPSHLQRFLQSYEGKRNVVLEGVFTHFASADTDDPTTTREQIQVFRWVRQVCSEHIGGPLLYHAANSAATFRYPESHFDMVRVGIATYGMSPFQKEPSSLGIEPILSLYSQIAHLVEVGPGEGVGYGHTFAPVDRCLIAVVPIGYGDGIFRLISNKGRVLIRGSSCPIVGNVCMDALMVDVSKIGEVRIGEEVVIIGGSGHQMITAEEIAMYASTINYEVTTKLLPRVPRVYEN